jgi:hypothetical protein
MDNEHRSFSRVNTRLSALARKVSSPESMPRFQGFPAPPTLTVGKLGGSLPQALIDFLTAMDAKLDMLISLESQERMRDDFPINLEITEISASGVSFRSAEPLETDTRMELVVYLSRFPLRMAGGMGRVVRNEQENGSWTGALEFTDIRDTDTEAIVQFVFQEQRQQLRKKWD